jgi:hypothetical protein
VISGSISAVKDLMCRSDARRRIEVSAGPGPDITPRDVRLGTATRRVAVSVGFPKHPCRFMKYSIWSPRANRWAQQMSAE